MILMEDNHTQRKTFLIMPVHHQKSQMDCTTTESGPAADWSTTHKALLQSSITTLCLTIPHHLLLSLMVHVMWLCYFTSCDPSCIINNLNRKIIILHFSRMVKHPITTMMRDVCSWHVVGKCWHPCSLPTHIPTSLCVQVKQLLQE